jgi:aminoglycoside phosphotransferase (APT) family kinase protein
LQVQNSESYWRRVYDNAIAEGRVLSGFYNRNYLYETDDQDVVVRVPVDKRDGLEPRMFTESALLQRLQSTEIPAPKVLWASNGSPYFQVHKYINGTPMWDRWPRGVAVPDHFIADSVRVMKILETVEPPASAPPAPWAQVSNCRDFLLAFIGWQKNVFSLCMRNFSEFYQWINMPDDPFAKFQNAARSLQARKLRLCHGDMQRLNCIIYNGETAFLDWELALLADPLWDIATHLHRMRYSPEEEVRFLAEAQTVLEHTTADTLTTDLDILFAFECVKSVTNDAYRYLSSVKGNTVTLEWKEFLASEYAWKLDLAAEFLPLRRRSKAEIAEYLDSLTVP